MAKTPYDIRLDRLAKLGVTPAPLRDMTTKHVNPLEQQERARTQITPFDAASTAGSADAIPLSVSPEAFKKSDIRMMIAQSPNASIVVHAANPVQALTAKRELEAAGRTVLVLNNFSAPVPEDEKQKVAQRFKGAEAGTAALIVVSEMTSTAQIILDEHPEIRDNVEKSTTDLDM